MLYAPLWVITPKNVYLFSIIMKYWRGGFKKQYWNGKLWGAGGPQWVQDYFLEEIDIFTEYLEMGESLNPFISFLALFETL